VSESVIKFEINNILVDKAWRDVFNISKYGR
jgi:hypothetical protein